LIIDEFNSPNVNTIPTSFATSGLKKKINIFSFAGRIKKSIDLNLSNEKSLPFWTGIFLCRGIFAIP
jgi:hypothetical protein